MIKTLLVLTLIAAILLFPYQVRAETENSYDSFRWVTVEKVEVVVETLNVRTGPGLDYPVVGIVRMGDVLDVLAARGNWYFVCLADGSIGVIAMDCVNTYSLRSYAQRDFAQGDSEMDSGDALLIFNRINSTRTENNLEPYILDEHLAAVAQVKADDMVENDYFGHYSEQYGTPLAMLKQFGVPYRSMTENIVGNITAAGAFTNIMADPVHRGSVLSQRYVRVGIGAADSEVYGKIIVMLFVQD